MPQSSPSYRSPPRRCAPAVTRAPPARAGSFIWLHSGLRQARAPANLWVHSLVNFGGDDSGRGREDGAPFPRRDVDKQRGRELRMVAKNGVEGLLVDHVAGHVLVGEDRPGPRALVKEAPTIVRAEPSIARLIDGDTRRRKNPPEVGLRNSEEVPSKPSHQIIARRAHRYQIELEQFD